MKLIKFSAEWCSPCRVLNEHLKVSGLYNKLEHIDVDDNANDELLVKYKIRGIPTILLVNEDGDVQKSVQGNITLDQVKAMIGELNG